MSDKGIIKDVISEASDRRSFVRKLGIASAVLGATTLGSKAQAQTTMPTISDADILNFALNLEYLEAEFYTVATTGKTIDQYGIKITGDTGTAGATTGGNKVVFSSQDPTIQNAAEELATNERTHVTLIQGALASVGAPAIAKPAIDLNALGLGFANPSDFLVLSRIFEEIGVTAYGGAAPLLKNPVVIGYAARILAVEAEHVGYIRSLITRYQIATTALDGADIIPPPSGVQVFSTDSNALTQVRTPGQVLFLAYGGAANATSGGFFPAGVNGILNMSSAAAATSDGSFIMASPNPIPVAAGATTGVTTITWNTSVTPYIQVRVNAPDGPLFTDNLASGSMMTNNWVTDGMVFYLQDVSYGTTLTSAHTLATVIVHLKTAS